MKQDDLRKPTATAKAPSAFAQSVAKALVEARREAAKVALRRGTPLHFSDGRGGIHNVDPAKWLADHPE